MKGINKISQIQWVLIAAIIVILIISIWIYRGFRTRQAKRIEIDSILKKHTTATAQDDIIINQYNVTKSEIALARDVALNVSILLETNSDLSWWDRNADNFLIISQLIWGNKGVWDQNIEEAKQYLNKVNNQTVAELVQTFYNDYTNGNNLKIDIDRHIHVKSTREIRIYKYLN